MRNVKGTIKAKFDITGETFFPYYVDVRLKFQTQKAITFFIRQLGLMLSNGRKIKIVSVSSLDAPAHSGKVIFEK